MDLVEALSDCVKGLISEVVQDLDPVGRRASVEASHAILFLGGIKREAFNRDDGGGGSRNIAGLGFRIG